MEIAMHRFLACAIFAFTLSAPASAPSTSATMLRISPRRRTRRRNLPVFAGGITEEGPGRSLFLSRRLFRGCSAEAHEFAEAIPRFTALGASVVGVSADDIEALAKFSMQACQSKFPVASDPTMNVIKSYDAVMKTRPEYANRISYVIAPNGKVVYHYINLNPSRHVERALGALRTWAQNRPK